MKTKKGFMYCRVGCGMSWYVGWAAKPIDICDALHARNEHECRHTSDEHREFADRQVAA